MTIKLALLMTGTELMLGDIIDSNSAMIAQQLGLLGLSVDIKITVGDSLPALVSNLQYLNQDHDIVIVNGGLGPTQDDLSSEAVCQAFNLNLIEHEKAKTHVIDWCQRRNFSANDANLKQALLPSTASIFENAPGSACAYHIKQKAVIIVTPGVPSELSTILKQDIRPFLNQQFAIKNINDIHYFQTFGLGESTLQNILHKQFPTLPQYYNVGFRAGLPLLELKLSSIEPVESKPALEIKAQFIKHIQENILSENQNSFAQSLIELFNTQQLTLGFAESCTGGLMAAEITKHPGSSAIFNGSIVSYNNNVKSSVLGVTKNTIDNDGAVSKACVKQMLNGAFEKLSCDYGAAVTGIAGPTGGTKDKPAGTVWLAFGNQNQQQIYCLNIPTTRNTFQQMLCAIVYDLLRRQVLGLNLKPKYLDRYLWV